MTATPETMGVERGTRAAMEPLWLTATRRRLGASPYSSPEPAPMCAPRRFVTVVMEAITEA